MDNLTHATLGGTLGGLASFRKLGKKAFYRGMLLANVPDIDVFVGPLLYGTSMQAQLFHRGPFHSLLFVLCIGPALAWIINKIYRGDKSAWWTWTLVAWICLLSHIFIDLLTSYGTRVLWPFSNTAFSLNSIFIIDPLYTIPLAVLFFAALFARRLRTTVRSSLAGLFISSVYLLASFGIKIYMNHAFVQAAEQQGISYTDYVTSPEPVQILLWKGMFANSGVIYQGWHSVLDTDDSIAFRSTDRHLELLPAISSNLYVSTLIDRSRGYYTLGTGGDNTIYLHDMRFGTINGWVNDDAFMYSYGFVRSGDDVTMLPWIRSFGRKIERDDVGKLWHRIQGIK